MHHCYTLGDHLIDQFDSTPDVLAYLESTRDKETGKFEWIAQGKQPSYWSNADRHNGSWLTLDSLESFLPVLNSCAGQYTREKLDVLRKLAVNAHIEWRTPDNVRVKRYANQGGTFHYPRLHSGQGHKAFSRRRREQVDRTGGEVTLIVPTSGAWVVAGSQLERASLAGYQLMTALENSGKRVSLWGFQYVRRYLPDIDDIEAGVVLHCLKSARSRARLTALLPICFGDYFRRFGFRVMEANSARYETPISDCYGYAPRRWSDAMPTLEAWAEHNGIDTDYMMITPEPSAHEMRDEESINRWLDETIEALNA